MLPPSFIDRVIPAKGVRGRGTGRAGTLLVVIGTMLVGAQAACDVAAQSVEPPPMPVGRDAVEIRDTIARMLDTDRAAGWGDGWSFAASLGQSVAPILEQAWLRESRRDRRVLLLLAAVAAAGESSVATVAVDLRESPRAQVEERVAALTAIAVGPRQRDVDAAGRQALLELANPSSGTTPATNIAACLALARMPTAADEASLRRLAGAADPGIAAAARFALGSRPAERGANERWIRTLRARDGHAELVLRGLLIGRAVDPSRSSDLEVGDAFEAVLQGLLVDPAAETTLGDALAVALATECAAGGARSERAARWLDRVDGDRIATSFRQALATTSAGRAELRARGWSVPVPPGLGTTESRARARVATAWILASPLAEAVATVLADEGGPLADPDLERVVPIALAFRLWGRSLEESAAVLAAVDDVAARLQRIEDPDVSASIAAAGGMGRGRELWTRRAMVRSLEDRLWRLDVHPARALVEAHRTFVADLLIVGGNTGAASLGRSAEARRAAYLPDGIDATADFVFTVLAELWKASLRPHAAVPPELRIAGG
jgi:hypothetical protein